MQRVDQPPHEGGAGRRSWLLPAIGAGLAASVLFNIAQKRKAEEKHPPEGKFINVDGVRLHYVERGTGRDLILLHGNGASIGDMESSTLLDRAAERYRVIVFDRPGYGHSTRPRGRAWTAEEQATLLWLALRSIGVTRPIIFGHSWGSLVAVAMGLQYPEETAALVLASGYYFPTRRVDAALASTPAWPVVGDAMRYTVSPLLARAIAPTFVRHIFAPAPVSPSFENFPIELSFRQGQLRASAAEAGVMVDTAERLSSQYCNLEMPIVLVSGDGDQLVPFSAHTKRLQSELRDGELCVVQGAGHMVHHTDPDAVLDAIDLAARKSEILSSDAELSDQPDAFAAPL